MKTIDINKTKLGNSANVICLRTAAKKSRGQDQAVRRQSARAAVTTLRPKNDAPNHVAKRNSATPKRAAQLHTGTNRAGPNIQEANLPKPIIKASKSKAANTNALGSCESSYFASLAGHTLLTADEEKDLATRAQQGDAAARNRMIEANLRLVVKVAKPYANRDVPMLDLISEGNLGLIHAIDKFKPEKGFRFSTYAIWWIREKIQNALMRQSNIVYMPIHAVKAQRICLRAQIEMRKVKAGEPSLAEVATACGKKTSEVASLLSRVEKLSSLEPERDTVAARPLIERLADTHCVDPLIALGNDDMQAALTRSVAMLDAEQKNVIIKRFGLHGEKPHTLQELSEELGMCRQTIKKLQDRAMRTLLGSLQH